MVMIREIWQPWQGNPATRRRRSCKGRLKWLLLVQLPRRLSRPPQLLLLVPQLLPVLLGPGPPQPPSPHRSPRQQVARTRARPLLLAGPPQAGRWFSAGPKRPPHPQTGPAGCMLATLPTPGQGSKSTETGKRIGAATWGRH